jgi:hypothetical protein
MMLAFTSSPSGTVHATVVQTADRMRRTVSVRNSVTLDDHVFSVANVAAYHDRFMIAWMHEAGMLDPGSGSQRLGIFASALELDGTQHPVEQLDDRLSWPGDVALGPEDGIVTFYGRERSGLAVLERPGAYKATFDVVSGARQSAIAASYAAGRYVVAATASGATITSPATGISVWFLRSPPRQSMPAADATTSGDIWSWWTFEALDDGSAMLVTPPAPPDRADLQPSGFLRVTSDGTIEPLPWPLDGWSRLGIVRFDDGLLAFKGRATVNDPRGLHFALLDRLGRLVGAPIWLPFEGDRAVVAIAPVDRSVHVLYDAEVLDDPPKRVVFGTRLVCNR